MSERRTSKRSVLKNLTPETGLFSKPAMTLYVKLPELPEPEGGAFTLQVVTEGQIRRALLEKLPLLALVVASSVVTIFAQRSSGGSKSGDTRRYGVRDISRIQLAHLLGDGAIKRGIAGMHPRHVEAGAVRRRRAQ